MPAVENIKPQLFVVYKKLKMIEEAALKTCVEVAKLGRYALLYNTSYRNEQCQLSELIHLSGHLSH